VGDGVWGGGGRRGRDRAHRTEEGFTGHWTVEIAEWQNGAEAGYS
jgi:hypothetical protein